MTEITQIQGSQSHPDFLPELKLCLASFQEFLLRPSALFAPLGMLACVKFGGFLAALPARTSGTD
jgi:hypothetical protein